MKNAIEIMRRYIATFENLSSASSKRKWNVEWMKKFLNSVKIEQVDDVANSLLGFFINIDRIELSEEFISAYCNYFADKIKAIINTKNVDLKKQKIKAIFEFLLATPDGELTYIDAFKNRNNRHDCCIKLFDTYQLWKNAEARDVIVNYSFE